MPPPPLHLSYDQIGGAQIPTGAIPVAADVGDVSTATGVYGLLVEADITVLGPNSAVLVDFAWSGIKRAATGNVQFRLLVDGVVHGGGTDGAGNTFQSGVGAGNPSWSAGEVWCLTLAAGLHTIRIEWEDTSGDEAIQAFTHPDRDNATLYLEEVPKP